jgi:hypothetical protein
LDSYFIPYNYWFYYIVKRMSERIDPQQRRGERLQLAADMLCYARAIGAGAIALLNVSRDNPRTWERAAAVAATYATDKADGILARQAAVDLDRPPTAEGKALDQKVDKFAHNVLAASHVFTAWQRGERLFAATMATSLGVQIWRDRVVNTRREAANDVAEATGIPIHTGSSPASKAKLALTAAADIGTQSPIAETPAGRVVLGTTHLAAAVLSMGTGMQIVDELRHDVQQALQPHDVPAFEPSPTQA